MGETNLSSEIQQQETHRACEKEPVLRVDVAPRDDAKRLKGLLPQALHAHQGRLPSSRRGISKSRGEILLLLAKVKASSKEALIDRDLFTGPPGCKVHYAYVHGGLV